MPHKLWHLAPVVLTVAGLASFVTAGFAAENDPTNNSSGNGNTAATAKPAADPAQAAQDDAVRHHAALGVLVSRSEDGVHVIGIMPGSPAERSGLRVGDEIRYVGDERIRTTQGLTDEIRKLQPGSQVDLSIRRNGDRQIVKATLGSADATRERAVENGNGGRGELAGGDGNNRREQSATRARGAYSYGPNNSQPVDPQQISQQLRALQQQISRLQQQIDLLRGNQNARINGDQQRSNAVNRAWNGSENEDDDPALFQ